MKYILLCGVCLMFFSCKPSVDYNEFVISYTSIGMGSNFMSLQPVFKVKNLKFTYTYEQTTHYEGQTVAKPETLQVGEFRKSSVDSILNLIADIKDTLIYKTNSQVWSGNVNFIYIKSGKKELTYDLHNDSDPVAEKIVEVINTYIADTDRKLWLLNVNQN